MAAAPPGQIHQEDRWITPSSKLAMAFSRVENVEMVNDQSLGYSKSPLCRNYNPGSMAKAQGTGVL